MQLLGGRCRQGIQTQEADIWIDTPQAIAEAAAIAAARGVTAFEKIALSSLGVDVELSGVYGSALDYFTDDITVPDPSGLGLGVQLDDDKLRPYGVG